MSIIERLKAKVHDTHRPHTAAELIEAEKRLGFLLPELLRRVYLEVGYGWPLLSSSSFGLSSVWQALESYRENRADAEKGLPPYPEKLLPICSWGCGIESVMDCSRPEGPVVRIDPNMDVPYILECFELVPDFKFYDGYSNEDIASWYEADTFQDWLEAWLRGEDLFRRPMRMIQKPV